MTEFADVLDAYKRAANSSQKKMISFDLHQNLIDLMTRLNNKSYRPGRYNCRPVYQDRLRQENPSS